MCERYTIDQALAVIRDRRDALQWQRRQYTDEIRDMMGDPECARYVPDAKRERSEVIHRINELDYLLEHLVDDIEEMLLLDELNERFYA